MLTSLMEKNENYYDYENLGPDTIKFALLDDNNAMLKGYNNGELDFIENLPVDEIPTYLADPDSLTLLIILEHTMYASTQRTRFSQILTSVKRSLLQSIVTIS